MPVLMQCGSLKHLRLGAGLSDRDIPLLRALLCGLRQLLSLDLGAVQFVTAAGLGLAIGEAPRLKKLTLTQWKTRRRDPLRQELVVAIRSSRLEDIQLNSPPCGGEEEVMEVLDAWDESDTLIRYHGFMLTINNSIRPIERAGPVAGLVLQFSEENEKARDVAVRAVYALVFAREQVDRLKRCVPDGVLGVILQIVVTSPCPARRERFI